MTAANWSPVLGWKIDGARHALLTPNWRLSGAIGYLALDIAALRASFAATGHPVLLAPLILAYLIGSSRTSSRSPGVSASSKEGSPER